MLRNYRNILWVIIGFLGIGMTCGQMNLSCEPFCLSKKTVCTCTVAGGTLVWELRNQSVEIAERFLDQDDLNKPTTLFPQFSSTGDIANSFEVIVTNSTSESITGTVSFITLAEYQGYVIICGGSASSPTAIITFPGIVSVTNLEVDSFTTDSVMLTFTTPNDSACVANYTITTAASAPPSTTDNTVTIAKPTDGTHVAGATYSVSVSAVDFAGRMGPPDSLECFMFDGPHAVTFTSGVDYMYVDQMQNDTCVAQFEWMVVQDCLPEVTMYEITTNSADQTVVVTKMVNDTTFSLQNVSSGEVYSVTITPSNTLGFGTATSTIITVPPSCSTTAESSPSSVPTTSSPAAAPEDVSGFPASAIAGIVLGIIAAVAICAVVVLVIVLVVVRMKKKKAESSLLSNNSVTRNEYEKNEFEAYKFDEGSEKAPQKPKRSRHSQEMKPQDAGSNQDIGTNHASSQGYYADLSYDERKSAKPPPPKSSEKVTYSDISHFPQTEYADLDVARGGRNIIPQKTEVVVYSELQS